MEIHFHRKFHLFIFMLFRKCPHFLLQFEELGQLDDLMKLPVGVNMRVHYCLSQYISLVMNWRLEHTLPLTQSQLG